MKVQLKSVLQIYVQFSDMDVFKDINVESTELWHKVLLLCKDKSEWCGVCQLALVIEICLCTPCSNAMLERFFNHLKVVKTDQRVSLSSSSLNSILHIKL